MKALKPLAQIFNDLQLLYHMGLKVLPHYHEIWAFFTAPAKKKLEESITKALLEDIKQSLGPTTPGATLLYVRRMISNGATNRLVDVSYQSVLDPKNLGCPSSYKYYHGIAFENLIESVLKSNSQSPTLREFVRTALEKLIITGTVVKSPKGECYLLSPGALETLDYANRVNSTTITTTTPANNHASIAALLPDISPPS